MPSHVSEPSSYFFLGAKMVVHLGGADTGGEFSLIETTIPPGSDSGLHLHAIENETIHIIEGSLEITIGGKTCALTKGQSALAPRNYHHRLRNTGQEEVRAFLIHTPGTFDRFVNIAGIPLHETTGLSPAPLTIEQSQELFRLAELFSITIITVPQGGNISTDFKNRD